MDRHAGPPERVNARPIDRTPRRIVLRGGFGVWTTGAFAALALLLLVDAVVRGAWAVAAIAAPWLAFAVGLAWFFAVRPCVIVTADALRIVNLTRTIDVPWDEIADLHVRYLLIVECVDGRTITAWGAPPTARPRRVQFPVHGADAGQREGGADDLDRRREEAPEAIERARAIVAGAEDGAQDGADASAGSTAPATIRTEYSWRPIAVLAGLAVLGTLAALVF